MAMCHKEYFKGEHAEEIEDGMDTYPSEKAQTYKNSIRKPVAQNVRRFKKYQETVFHYFNLY